MEESGTSTTSSGSDQHVHLFSIKKKKNLNTAVCRMLIEEAINVWLRIINNNNKTIVKSESYRSGYSALVILLGALKL